MALIKGITFSFVLLIGAALPTASIASEDELLIREFRESLSKNIRSEMSGQFRTDLTEAGLSPADVDRIVADLEDKVAACFLDSIVEYARLHEVPLTDLIIEGGSGKVISFEGGEGVEFKELLIPCLTAARAEAGISAN